MIETCDYMKSHPVIDARLGELERRMTKIEETVDRKVDGLHTRITEVKTDLASARGWVAGAAALGAALSGIVMFLLNKLFSP